MVTPEPTGQDRAVQPADLRNRPVVLESGSADRPPRRRRRPWPRTVFGIAAAGILAAAGVVAGSWSIMSAVGTTTPPGDNAPLWFSPPAPVATTPGGPQPSTVDSSQSGSGSDSGEVESGHHHEGSGSGSPTAHRQLVTPVIIT